MACGQLLTLLFQTTCTGNAGPTLHITANNTFSAGAGSDATTAEGSVGQRALALGMAVLLPVCVQEQWWLFEQKQAPPE